MTSPPDALPGTAEPARPAVPAGVGTPRWLTSLIQLGAGLRLRPIFSRLKLAFEALFRVDLDAVLTQERRT